MGKKLPYMQFYPADWRADTQRLSLATRAVWMEILLQMHIDGRTGELSGSVAEIARACGAFPPEIITAVRELSRLDICANYVYGIDQNAETNDTKTVTTTAEGATPKKGVDSMLTPKMQSVDRDVDLNVDSMLTVVSRRMKREAKHRQNSKISAIRKRYNRERCLDVDRNVDHHVDPVLRKDCRKVDNVILQSKKNTPLKKIAHLNARARAREGETGEKKVRTVEGRGAQTGITSGSAAKMIKKTAYNLAVKHADPRARKVLAQYPDSPHTHAEPAIRAVERRIRDGTPWETLVAAAKAYSGQPMPSRYRKAAQTFFRRGGAWTQYAGGGGEEAYR